MASNQLTSLSAVKAWAGVTSSNDDALLNRLINSSSRFVLSFIERPSLFKQQYADVVDGVGQRSQLLRNWPVISVSSVVLGSQSFPPSPGYPQSGFVFDAWDGTPPGSQQKVSLYGYCFPYDVPAGISITYTAGFVVQNEAQVVPASPYAVAVNAPYGSWGADAGVTYAGGAALSPVASSPSAGQYVPPVDPAGSYQFSAADTGASVLISYSYIPADIEDACINMVGERYSYKNRIGMVSKSLSGQEVMTYSQKNMSDYTSTLLMPYKSFVPI